MVTHYMVRFLLDFVMLLIIIAWFLTNITISCFLPFLLYITPHNLQNQHRQVM